jgi:hypothetical protein
MKTHRRQFLATLGGTVAAAFFGLLTKPLRAISPKPRGGYDKVVWMKLTNEPLGPGDVWASCDPNMPERQGDAACEANGWASFNLQMQAVHPSNYGGRPNQGFERRTQYGAYIVGNVSRHWRPVGIVHVDQVPETYLTDGGGIAARHNFSRK